MVEFLLALSGKLANQIIDLYLAHQFLLNTVVVAYGVLLAVAHANLQRIERMLLSRYGTEVYEEALEAMALEEDQTVIERFKKELRFPIIASPYFFAMHRISRHTLIFVIGKKQKLPRRRLEELLTVERSHIES
ncbi:MAG: hypothetical protein ACLFPW_03615 [Spirochaetaceae bacterium]